MLKQASTALLAMACVICATLPPGYAETLPDEPFGWLNLAEERNTIQFYPFGECRPECPEATAICENDDLRFILHDFFPEEIVTWLGMDDVPFRGEGAGFSFVIRADGLPTVFPVSRLDLSDRSGNWGVEGVLSGQSAREWLGVFGAAVDLLIESPTRQIALSSRPEEQAKRATFVEACLAR